MRSGGVNMALRSLKEANNEARKRYSTYRLPRLNGIACPDCGTELIDTNPGQVLTSSSPLMVVHCPKCKYQGSRVA